MESFESLSSAQPQRVYIGGGSAGESAAGYNRAVDQGLVAGVTEANAIAIISMADSGGASGWLRQKFGGAPAGDVRRSQSAMSRSQKAAKLSEQRFSPMTTLDDIKRSSDEMVEALSEVPSSLSSQRVGQIMDQTLSLSREIESRLSSEGKTWKGLTLGHIVLTALDLEYNNIDTAAQESGKLMAIRGDVIPVSIVPHHLIMRDGPNTYYGEHVIDERAPEFPKDVELSLYAAVPYALDIPTNPRAIAALERATEVVAGPGSRRTSIGAAALLLQPQLQRTKAEGLTVALGGNLYANRSEPERDGTDHVAEIEKYAGGRRMDVIISNNNTAAIPDGKAVWFDIPQLREDGYEVIETDLVQLGEVKVDEHNPIQERATIMTNTEALAIAIPSTPGTGRDKILVTV